MDKKQTSRVEELENALNLIRRTKIHSNNISGLKNAEGFFLLLLSSLNNGEPVTPSEAAEKLGVTMAAITHHINSLEKQEFITRTLSDEDRRVWFIGLTAKGKGKIKIIKKEHRKRLNDLVDYLGDKDSQKMIHLLKKISEFFKEQSVGKIKK
jgi:DNA-binding MarR family transcriptional regulator